MGTIITIIIVAFIAGVAWAVFKKAAEFAVLAIIIAACYFGYQWFRTDIKSTAKKVGTELSSGVTKKGEKALDKVGDVIKELKN